MQPQFAFHVAVEGRAGQPDDHDHHADVDEIAAIAPGVAANQQNQRGKDVAPALFRDHAAPRPNSERIAVSTAAAIANATSA